MGDAQYRARVWPGARPPPAAPQGRGIAWSGRLACWGQVAQHIAGPELERADCRFLPGWVSGVRPSVVWSSGDTGSGRQNMAVGAGDDARSQRVDQLSLSQEEIVQSLGGRSPESGRWPRTLRGVGGLAGGKRRQGEIRAAGARTTGGGAVGAEATTPPGRRPVVRWCGRGWSRGGGTAPWRQWVISQCRRALIGAP